MVVRFVASGVLRWVLGVLTDFWFPDSYSLARVCGLFILWFGRSVFGYVACVGLACVGLDWLPVVIVCLGS